MSNLNPLLQRNRAFAAAGSHEGLTAIPEHQVLVLTCMDGRVDPARILGIELGDALVVRNSGGRVTDDVLQEVAFIGAVTEMMFGDQAPPFEVAVLHHTGCGTGFLADTEFRATFAARTGADDRTLAESAVTDPRQTVLRDVERLIDSPLRPARASVSGHVYDVDTGLVTTVVAAAEANR